MTTSLAPLPPTSPTMPYLVTTPPDQPVRRLRLCLAHDNDLVRRGLEALAGEHDDLVLVPSADRSDSDTPDLVLLDPPDAGLTQHDVAQQVWLARPGRVVLFTWRPSARLQSIALLGGAAGCVSASAPAEQLLDDLRRIRDGEVVTHHEPAGIADSPLDQLTLRERQVLGLVASGASNDQVARHLSLSMNTIKTYVRSAYRKIGVECRSQAVVWALEHRCVGRAAGLGDASSQEPPGR